MAIFDTGSPAYQVTAVTATAGVVFSLTPTVSGSPYTLVNPRDITLVNSGPSTVYVGQVGVTATTGIPVAVGDQLTLQGPAIALSAICASGQTSTIEAGLATVAAVD